MSERVLCVLHNIKSAKAFGTPDAYNMAVTNYRCIFAKFTADILKQASAEANAQGQAEGKGFFERWADQLTATLFFGNRYLGWPGEAVLAECPGNFAIEFTNIHRVTFREKRRYQEPGQIIVRIYGEVTFDTTFGKYTYQLDNMPVDDIAAMRGVMGNLVQG
ncbi:MAG: hypothetical protein PHG35_08470 [Dehalococcoidales bacterium]|nr:hypothetical protein [Dehalococcoidales bacterium]